MSGEGYKGYTSEAINFPPSPVGRAGEGERAKTRDSSQLLSAVHPHPTLPLKGEGYSGAGKGSADCQRACVGTRVAWVEVVGQPT